MSFILGISAFYHDSAAALIKDGEIIAAAQEERFTRKKHDSSYPYNAVNFVLKFARINLNDVDNIVFYEKPFLKFERLLETYVAFAPKGFKSFTKAMPIWLKEKLFQKKLIIDYLKSHDDNFKDEKKILFSEHHLSHAASAFYPSPFENAIILTADGVGEWATTTVAIGNKNSLEIKKELHFPHSLGLLYSAFTYYTGFKVNSGEYKLMGLAPYGKPKYTNQILNKYGTFEELVASGELGQWDFLMGIANDNWKPIAVQKAAIEEIVRAEEIQAGVPKFVTEAEVQKEVASRLNSLLSYLKKTAKVSSPPGNAMGGTPRVARAFGNPNPTMNIGMTEQIDTPQGDMSMTEDVIMSDPKAAGAGNMPGQANNDPYTLLRTRLPQEISDDVVRLIAYNPDAFADFASIENFFSLISS